MRVLMELGEELNYFRYLSDSRELVCTLFAPKVYEGVREAFRKGCSEVTRTRIYSVVSLSCLTSPVKAQMARVVTSQSELPAYGRVHCVARCTTADLSLVLFNSEFGNGKLNRK